MFLRSCLEEVLRLIWMTLMSDFQFIMAIIYFVIASVTVFIYWWYNREG